MTETTSEQRRPRAIIDSIPWARLPWWGFILIISGLVIAYLILADSNYNATFLFLVEGAITTVRITFFSYILALILGLITGIARTSKNPIIYTISTLYVEIVRGIPMIVLILYVAFGIVPLLVTFTNWIGSLGLGIGSGTALEPFFFGLTQYSIRNISMELRGILALGFGYGAYEAEIFRAGIQAIGKGQIEAARSLGMTYFQSLRFIVLPQAIRAVLPPLGNDFISLLKDSALLTVLAVSELTQLGRQRRASTFRVFETFNVVVFLYLMLTLVLSGGVRYLERKMKIED
jgi:polar amino acid transport system permease protein